MNTFLKFLPFLLVFTISCGDDDSNSSNTNAKAVYNQAYQENFDADTISSILLNANDAYVLVDPFLPNVTESIAAIKANGNEVGAYISIGTGENWRDDFTAMEDDLVGTQWAQWDGEFFVNTVSTAVVDVMKARIDKIAEWGCNWVEFDNMDWVYDDNLRETYGFQVTIAEGAAFAQELCEYVQSKGMKCMAKNMTENSSNFDGVLYESYDIEKNWWDTSGAQNFISAGKLVIINHYNETNCDAVYNEYKVIYGDNLSYICEDSTLGKYIHYNE